MLIYTANPVLLRRMRKCNLLEGAEGRVSLADYGVMLEKIRVHTLADVAQEITLGRMSLQGLSYGSRCRRSSKCNEKLCHGNLKWFSPVEKASGSAVLCGSPRRKRHWQTSQTFVVVGPLSLTPESQNRKTHPPSRACLMQVRVTLRAVFVLLDRSNPNAPTSDFLALSRLWCANFS